MQIFVVGYVNLLCLVVFPATYSSPSAAIEIPDYNGPSNRTKMLFSKGRSWCVENKRHRYLYSDICFCRGVDKQIYLKTTIVLLT